jgi:RND family efflux transporter MFP subunit
MDIPLKRRTMILIGILVATTILFLSSCSDSVKEHKSDNGKPVQVQLKTATQRPVGRINVSGQIESQETAAISTRVMGFISSIKVKPGDRVEKGQLLVTISNGDILAKRAQAEAMRSEAEAALKDAQKDYQRFEELFKQLSATEKEFENAALRLNSIKAKSEAARQMENEVTEMLAYTHLIAPFSGLIVQKIIVEGSMASPGMPILILEKDDRYQVKAFVSEDDVDNIEVGMIASFTVKSSGKKFSGAVSEISPSSQFTGGRFQIKIDVPSIDNKEIQSGSYVNVSIAASDQSQIQSLFVPASAIIHKDQLSGLYTVGEDQTAQLRWLKLGKISGDEIEILSGLKPQEQFIAQSDGKLYSGVPVVVK